MAAADRGKSAALSEQLLGEPHRFNFFQAVRLLEHLARERAGQDPAGPRYPVGGDQPPEREVVRFRALAALSFPAASVGQSRPPAAGEQGNGAGAPFELVVSFLGLTGPAGVLPFHYTRQLLQRLRAKDTSLRDFLDLFNHRLVSLFYRAWVKYRLPFAFERSRLDPGSTGTGLMEQGLYSFVGQGTGGLRGRLGCPDEVFLHYSGHLAHYPRSAIALECLLTDYFEVPVRVEQLQGQWLTVEPDDRSLMPGPAHPRGRNNQLGVNLLVGERVWDVQSNFRLRVGPLSYRQFLGLLPSGPGLRPLCQIARWYVGPEFTFDVQLVLRAADVPPCRLVPGGEDAPCLGLNTWVRCDVFQFDVSDAVFFLDDV
jgi:type VI secretion system protein ImpH